MGRTQQQIGGLVRKGFAHAPFLGDLGVALVALAADQRVAAGARQMDNARPHCRLT
ncbi:hypothetical protein [Halopseudomonas maritima]|uniref:hypothetical protein n=1 Tax=Halopseudomonas maritima TaxID=2918528 RepID=UPI001EEAEFDA|nr:hypothetical protein [Halopseudomonas maritima]UJJ30926.1 hypothetical protein HV822_14315 [Halopseudomonas maritima]